MATTVVDAQFESDAELSGGDGHAERESDEELARGSDDVSAVAGGLEGTSATEQYESSSDDTGDGNAGARSHSGNVERPDVHNQGGMMGAKSDGIDGPQKEYVGVNVPSTSRNRGVQSGGGLSRSDVEDMFEQRVLIEMRLRIVKLEIFEHVTGEFTRLRDFISTLVRPPVSTPPTAPQDVHPDTVPSSFSPRVPGGDMGTELHGIQNDDAPTSGALDVGGGPIEHDDDLELPDAVPGGDMGLGLHGIQMDDALTTSGALDVGGDAIKHDDDLELPDACDVRAVPTRRRRSSRLRMPAASTRTPYTRSTRRTNKK